MTIYTHEPPCGSTSRSFSTTDSPVLARSVNPPTLVGNIIPHEWYQTFTNNRGVPDLSLMSVLSEIVYWYRPKKLTDPNTMAVTYVNKFLGDAWQTSYEHFEKKFGFNREKLRRIFVKLEQMGICAREFRDIRLRGQIYNNRLFIHLSSDFLNSCTGNKRKVSAPENYTINCNTSLSAPKEEGGSPHFEGDHITDTKNKNIIKDRSIESTFCKNSFEESQPKITTQPNNSKTQGSMAPEITDQIQPQHSSASLQLKDFYPLSESDASHLQSSSGREFSLNAMNEILLDMSARVKDRWFKSKKGFLSYMSLVFKHEMRDAYRVSNEGFRIKANRTAEEITVGKQEEFLSQIEYSLQVSPEWHLKKKLCAVFEREKAYNLLSSYKRCRIEGNTFEIHLTRNVELTELDRDIILNQVKASHNSFNLATGDFVNISSLKIVAPPASAGTKSKQAIEEKTVFPAGIWGSIRQALVSYYGSSGEGLDRSWFSRLEPEVNEEAKTIKLKAPTEFIRDWVYRNYLNIIERIIRGSGNSQYKVSLC